MTSQRIRPISKLAGVFAFALFISAVVFHPGRGRPYPGASSDYQMEVDGRTSEDLQVYLPIIARHCYLQFFDDFSDPTSGWPTDGLPLTTYWEGEYLIYVTSDDRWGIGVADSPLGPFSDYLVTADVRKELGSGLFGLYFNMGSEGGYIYLISDGGSYNITLREVDWNSVTGWSYTTLVGGISPALIVGGVNTIAIERTGAEIRAYANGEQIAGVADDTFTGPGNAGFWISSGGYTNSKVFFDNFKVEPSGCGWSAGSD